MINNTTEVREFYFSVWQKQHSQEPLDALEQEVWRIIEQHPEYHFVFLDQEKYLEHTFTPGIDEVNPFLHLSMHHGLQEQLSTNKPAVLRDVYQKLLAKHQDAHAVEHQIMEVFAKSLWDAMQGEKDIDAIYCERLQRLL